MAEVDVEIEAMTEAEKRDHAPEELRHTPEEASDGA